MSIYDWSTTLRTHRQCVGDSSRIESYQDAIAEVIKQGDVVVDVGTGTGILGMMACRAGAKKVYAIEPDQIIELARQICTANGLTNQIVFLPGLSYEVSLPDKADVLIAGHLHNFGVEMGLLSSIIDAQKRFLKPKASIIPQSVDLFVVPIELPDTYNEVIEFWKGRPAGFDYASVRELAVENCYMVDLRESSFLSEPTSLVTIRFDQLDDTFISGRSTFIVSRNGVLHGIGGWCSAELSPNVTISNNPVLPSVHWAQIYFPIEDQIAVKSGDRVLCSVDTNDGHTWRWRVDVLKGTDIRPSARFDHSTFRPGLISKETLRKKLPAFTPHLSRQGAALLAALSLCDGQRTLEEIQKDISFRFGECFASPQVLSNFITEQISPWIE